MLDTPEPLHSLEGFDDPLFVALYEAIDAKRDIDVPFYLALAKEVGPQKILDVACGDGRLMLPMLEHGMNVVGVDGSSVILQLLQDRAASLGLVATTTRTTFAELSTIRHETLGAPFALILVTFNSFMHALEREDQYSLLESLHVMLAPRGRLVVEVDNPTANDLFAEAEWPREREHSYEAIDIEGMNNPCSVQSWITVVNDLPNQRGELLRDYEIIDAASVSHTRHSIVTYRWTYAFEMRALLEQTGFHEITVFGGYNHEAFTDASPIQLWIARRG